MSILSTISEYTHPAPIAGYVAICPICREEAGATLYINVMEQKFKCFECLAEGSKEDFLSYMSQDDD